MEVEGAILSIMKAIYKKPRANIVFNGQKLNAFPLRPGTRVSPFTTSIQHSIASSTYSDHTRKRNKRHPKWKEEVKQSLFADNMIVYIEHNVDFTKKKKLLHLVSEFGKSVGYKVNIQKSKAFLYINNKISGTEIRKRIPFAKVTRKIKYLGINLTKEVKDLYSENYTTLKKDI